MAGAFENVIQLFNSQAKKHKLIKGQICLQTRSFFNIFLAFLISIYWILDGPGVSLILAVQHLIDDHIRKPFLKNSKFIKKHQ